MNYECVTTLPRFKSWLKDVAASKRFAIDCETTGKNAMTANLVGVSLSLVPGTGCYIPVGHETGEPQLPLDDVLEELAYHTQRYDSAKVLHNALYDMVVLGRYGLEFNNVDDTQYMAYTLDVLRHGHFNDMDNLALFHLGHRTIKFHEVVHEKLGMRGFQDVRHFHATQYAAEDTDVTLGMYYTLRRQLKERGLWRVYAEMDRRALPAVADMKLNGVAISKKQLAKVRDQFQERIDELNAEIQEIAPGLDDGSSRSLAKYLFEDQGLEALKKTPKGAPSVDKEALEAMEDLHEVIPPIMEKRKFAKLLNTYVEPMPEKLVEDTGRLHTNLNMAFTVTARLSSSDPNLQNIPNPDKGPEGELIRSAFVAPKGYKIIAADYSQIELRVLAHVTGDKTLVNAYRDGKDIHSATAEIVFGTTEAEAGERWGGLRRNAKTINFGLVYGITKFGLSKQLKVDPETAQGFIDGYFDKLPGVSEWIEEQKERGLRDRYVETIYGRRLYLSEGNDKFTKSSVERQSTNYPIQGGAADLIRLAMGDVREYLIEYKIPATMLLQVHDELLFECPDEAVDDAKAVIKAAMEQAGGDWIDWRVPIVSSVKSGENWRKAH